MPRSTPTACCLIGDWRGFLNGMRLKGIHLAIKSGMLAAETAFDALAAEKTDAATLSSYETRFRDVVGLRRTARRAQLPRRVSRAVCSPGCSTPALAMFTGGRGFGFIEKLKAKRLRADAQARASARRERETPRATIDNVLTFDKLTDVFNSGTMHDERSARAPARRRYDVCADRCTVEYGNPCQYFCPAKVYEPLLRRKNGERVEGRLQINFTNCVHCKTCDIMDPYQIITWVPPQGGEGPVYTL